MSLSSRTWWVAIGAVLTLSGCAKRDLRVLCDTATEVEAKHFDPATQAVVLAKLSDERLSHFSDVRKLVTAISLVDPQVKLALFTQGALDLGYPDWRCPAMERILAPPRDAVTTP